MLPNDPTKPTDDSDAPSKIAEEDTHDPLAGDLPPLSDFDQMMLGIGPYADIKKVGQKSLAASTSKPTDKNDYVDMNFTAEELDRLIEDEIKNPSRD